MFVNIRFEVAADCQRPGHIGSKCRSRNDLRSSICKKLAVKTSECTWITILEAIPTKLTMKPLRIENSPMKLVIDVSILADIYTASINPMNENSSGLSNISDLLRFG